MSRRMLDSSIWSNEKFAALPAWGRLLQIGMINLADDQGRLKAHPLYLVKEIFAYDKIEAAQVSKWLELMQENGTVHLYTSAGKEYAQFINWWQYQSLQFAHASKYPRPEGWTDCIRFNGKGNQMMVCNWTTPKGEKMLDTCDQEGKPLPFVMELPAAKVPAEVAPQEPTQAPAKVPAEVPTQAGTQVRTLAPTQVATNVASQAPAEVPTQVTYNLTNNYQLPTKEETTTTTARPLANFAAALLLPEWNGGGDFLATLDDKDLVIAAEWLWLYQKLKAGGAYSLNEVAMRYKPSPFAGVDNPPGFIRRKVEKHTPAPLHFADRAEFNAELRQLQEAQS